MLRQLLINSEGSQRGRISMISNKILTASNGLEYYYVEIMNDKGVCHVIEAYGNDATQLESEVMKLMNEDKINMTKLPYISTILYCQD